MPVIIVVKNAMGLVNMIAVNVLQMNLIDKIIFVQHFLI